MEVSRLSVRVTADVDDAEQGLQRVQRSVQRLSGWFQQASATAAGMLASTAGVGAVQALFAAGRDAVLDFNASLEQSAMAWTTMFKSADVAKAFLFDLQQFAAKTPFEFPDVEQGARRLLAMGFAARDIKPMLTAIGNAAAGLGLGAQGIDRLTLALGQMQAKGKVTGEELRQLTEAGISISQIFEIMARQTGRSVAELQRMQEQGELAADVFTAAFVEFTQQNFGGMMEQQAQTFRGAMSTIRDSLRLTAATAFRPLFDRISELAQRIAAFVQSDDFQVWGARIAATIQVILEGLGVLGEGFRITLQGIAAVTVAAGRVIFDALQLLNPFARHSPSLVESVEVGVERILERFSALQAIASPLRQAGRAIAELGRAAQDGLARAAAALETLQAQTVAILGAGVPPAFRAAAQAVRALEQELAALEQRVLAQEDVVAAWRQALDDAGAAVAVQERLLRGLDREFRQHELAVRQAAAVVTTFREAADQARGKVEDLRSALRTAQDRLRELVEAPLQGTRAFEDRLAALNQQIAAVQLRLAELRLARAPAAQIRQLERELETLQLQAEKVRLERTLRFDPLRQQIQRLVDTRKELSFAEIVRGIRQEQGAIGQLDQELTAATAAWTAQVEQLRAAEAAYRAVQDARDRVREQIEAERLVLDQLRDAHQEVQERYDAEQAALAALRGAYDAAQAQAQRFRSALEDTVRQAEQAARTQEALARSAAALASAAQGSRDILAGLDLTEAQENLARWKEEFERTAAVLRETMLPSLQQARDSLAQTGRELETVARAIDALQGPVRMFAGLAAVLAGSFLALRIITGPLQALVQTIGRLGAVLASAGSAGRLFSLLLGKVPPQLLLVAGAAALLYTAWRTNFLGLRDVTDAAAQAIAPALENLGTLAQETASGLAQAWAEHAPRLADAAQAAFQGLQDAVGPPFRAVVSFIQEEMGVLTQWWAENLPLLEQIASAAWGALVTVAQDVWGQLTEIVGEALASLGTLLRGGLAALAKFWAEHGEEVLAIVRAAWEGFKAVIDTALKVVLGIIAVGLRLLTGDWQGAWAKLGDVVETAWQGIQRASAAGRDALLGILRLGWSMLAEGARPAWEGLERVIRETWDSIRENVRTGVNGVIGLLNDLLRAWNSLRLRIPPVTIEVPKIELPGGGTLGGQRLDWPGLEIAPPQAPEIPRLAHGGLVTRPTLALLGEAGPELVLPLGGRAAGGGGGGAWGQLPPVQVDVTVNAELAAGSDPAAWVAATGEMVRRAVVQTLEELVQASQRTGQPAPLPLPGTLVP